MPKITAVHFRAFNRFNKEFFVDKTPVEIHTALMDICPTYITVSIYESETAELIPVSTLDQFPRPDKEKYN
jgi:hypothetical protein